MPASPSRAKAIRCILVAPRASHNWTDDSECVDRPNEHIATYVVNDVVREVDSRFRTIADRGGARPSPAIPPAATAR